MNVHFDKSPTVLTVLRGVDKRAPMSYPYIVMPDAKLSHNLALLLRTIRRGHAYGFDILDSAALAGDTVSPALGRLEPHHLIKSKCETEEVAFADQRLAGKSFQRARNH